MQYVVFHNSLLILKMFSGLTQGEDLSAHSLFGNFSQSTGMRGRGIEEEVKALTWMSY